ncbi:MAG: heavy-metal-associated domain-containing protein [Verrucomicrobia bacterium]|nr:heavy-metal-associated domain-containing protein [Verrucomicrobiota bacterium]MCH8526310.1 cation transporter [Kiritimatiellia bacterium]
MKFLLLCLTALLLNACGRAPAAPESETAHVSIRGMTCENCVQGILSTLERVPGFAAATINLETESAEIQFDPSKVNGVEIAERISRIGYPASVVTEDVRE